jgi:hypothetical protein
VGTGGDNDETGRDEAKESQFHVFLDEKVADEGGTDSIYHHSWVSGFVGKWVRG